MSAIRLIIIGGPSRGTVVPLTERTTIGRDPKCSLVIGDLALSKQHCAIDPGPPALLSDLDSRNGTQINGLPIRTHHLVDGDQIRVGDSVLLFVAGGAAQLTPPPSDASTASAPLVVDAMETGRITFTTEQPVQHDLVGESAAMADVTRRIARAAPSNSTVLITGESGTGKELVARAIHAASARSSGPFVAINCAAVPDGLMESELFGHERGAFTGAIAQKRGRIESANGGTVFLDEIGELPAALQVKLLRALQERQIDRVGGTRPVPVDIRIVAATNRDLGTAVKEGTFRSDLYYRLNVIAIAVPPLRDRAGDVGLLAAYFVRQHAARAKRRGLRGLTREARAALTSYDWPGNVRELENAIERAVVMSSGDWIDVIDLPENLIEISALGADDGYHARVNHAKRETIRKAIELADGNIAHAARQLKLQPTYLHRLIRNLRVRGE